MKIRFIIGFGMNNILNKSIIFFCFKNVHVVNKDPLVTSNFETEEQTWNCVWCNFVCHVVFILLCSDMIWKFMTKFVESDHINNGIHFYTNALFPLVCFTKCISDQDSSGCITSKQHIETGCGSQIDRGQCTYVSLLAPELILLHFVLALIWFKFISI